MVSKLYLIRHGQINANVDRHWHGSTDSELNELGLSQAEALSRLVPEKYPNITKVYASPLRRTFRTAQLAFSGLGLEPLAEQGLREYGIGDLEGEHFETLVSEHQFFEKIASDPHFAPSNGESLFGVRDRVVESAERIIAQHPGEEVALVGHGAAFGILLSHWLSERVFPFGDFHMDNTGVTVLTFDPVVTIEMFNDLSHLD